METVEQDVEQVTDGDIETVLAGEAPEEIEQDAVAELDRIHEANRFGAQPPREPDGYDPSYGIGTSPVDYGQSLDFNPTIDHRRPASAPEPSLPSSRELYSLEDLYDAYPEIGGGSYSLRVVRKHPTNFGGVRCAGWIEDLHEQITMSDFASRFGGHVYEVTVRGPGQRTSTLDADGRVQVKTLTKIRLEVPGPPILQPAGGDNMGANQQPNSLFGGFREDPRVSMKKLDLEAEERRRREQREDRARQEILSRSSVSPELIEIVERAADKRGEDVRRAGAEVIASLRDQNRRLSEQAEIREKEIQKVRQDMLTLQQEMALKLREEETRQVRELRDRFNDETRRMKEDHAEAIARMQAEHQRVINDLTERAQRERDHITKMEQMERERLRDDAARREASLKDEYARRERDAREKEESRLKDLERSYDRELRGVKDMRDREIESIRSSETGRSKLTEKTAEIQVSMLQQEVARMSAEHESLRRENEDLRGKLNKPPMEAVREAHEIAAMTGFRGAGGGEEEEFDWKRGAVSAIRGLIEKAPEIAKGFGDAREQNRIAVARAQQQAQMARNRAAQSARQQQRLHEPARMSTEPSLPTPTEPPDHRPAPPPGVARPRADWAEAAGPPEPWSTSHLPDGSSFRPVVDVPEPAAHHIGSKAPAPANAPPISGGDVVAPSSFTTLADREPAASAPKAPDESVAEPELEPVPEGPIELQITEDQVHEFGEQLEMAIATGAVSADEFAKRFIEQVGVDTTRTIINRITADQFVDAVQQQQGASSTAIVTRAGRKYVQRLWEETRKLLEALGS